MMSDTKKVDWEDFFERNEDSRVKIIDWGGDETIPLEELYQVFKQRLMSELRLGTKLKKSKS